MAKSVLTSKSEGENYTEKLGKELDHFPIRNQFFKRWLLLATGIFSILCALVLLVSLIIQTWRGVQLHGRAFLLWAFSMPVLLYLLLLITGSLLVFLAKIYWWDGITVFENGLLKRTREKDQVWRYQDSQRFDNYITQIKLGGSIIAYRVKLILENESNSCLVIRNLYEQMEELIQIIRLGVLPGLLHRTRQRLQNGESVTFHQEIIAERNGLQIKGELIPYHQIKPEIKNEMLRLYQKDDQNKLMLKSHLEQIRNLDLLIDLIENPLMVSDHPSPK
jgi:hypothetical protein